MAIGFAPGSGLVGNELLSLVNGVPMLSMNFFLNADPSKVLFPAIKLDSRVAKNSIHLQQSPNFKSY